MARQLAVEVVVRVDPDSVREVVNTHAERLREDGRREVINAILDEMDKSWSEGVRDRMKNAMSTIVGSNVMSDILAQRIVDKARVQRG